MDPDFKKINSITVKYLFVSFLCLSFAVSGCSKQVSGDQKNYRFNGTMTVDGMERTYLLNLPPDYYDTSNLPLVIALHGLGGNAAECERDYGITEKGNAAGFVVVYPEGVRNDGILGLRTWNAGTCCQFAMEHNIDDVHFVSVLIDTLLAHYAINPKKVYVTGMSNGAMLTYRLACELSGKIAAIAAVSGTLLTTGPCKPGRAVPVLHIHSLQDEKVPYYGGTGLDGYYFPPVDSGLNVWANIDACSETPVVVDYGTYTFSQWNNSGNGATVECYLTKDGGHAWPGGLKSSRRSDTPSTAINATDVIWDFFKQYSLPRQPLQP